jgi:hypothetical protein
MHTSLVVLTLVACGSALPWATDTFQWRDGTVKSDGWINAQTAWIVETPFWFCVPLDATGWRDSGNKDLIARVSCTWSDDASLSDYENNMQGRALFASDKDRDYYTFDAISDSVQVTHDPSVPGCFQASARVLRADAELGCCAAGQPGVLAQCEMRPCHARGPSR